VFITPQIDVLKSGLFMRRGVSIAVLSVMLTSLLVPLALANPSTLPTCCRTGGKHHCTGSMETTRSVGFKSAAMLCPYRHQAAVTSQAVALATARQCVVVLLLEGKTPQSTLSTIYSHDLIDAHKRGPPAA
jgi:hypothetical protein